MANRYFDGIDHAAIYAAHRPLPPQSLIDRTLKFLREKVQGPLGQAVDVGCGSGQTTSILGRHFEKVLGVDVSEAQIQEARKKETAANVSYKVGPAEEVPFEDSSVELVTSGQACHWFDHPKFFSEVDRVLVPGGVIALYAYSYAFPMWQDKAKTLNKLIVDFAYGELLFADQVHMIDNYYADIQLPYEDVIRLQDDSFYVEIQGTAEDMFNEMRTWSGFNNYKLKHGEEAVEEIFNNFKKRFMKEMGVSVQPQELELPYRFYYFLVLTRKPQ
ncbi:putative methyltransferase DDB_G0268948 [Oratosquilla oratoria]|uniref:putative methyltransferase DDB_G0268948 n=1 Tax=Oratosquilla oratoria TaxID=337810 RepID=UPI003F75C12B